MFKRLFSKQKKDQTDSEEPISEDNAVSTDTPATPFPSEPAAKQEKSVEKKSWLSRLKSGLGQSSSKIGGGITDIFIKRKLDDETLEELEELLIMADLGVTTASALTTALAKDRFDKEISSDEIKQALAEQITAILQPVALPLPDRADAKPQVILMAGVNGNGKTTTIGKIAKQLQLQGKTVMLAACDTFRAAAVNQLKVWAERTNTPIITGKENADPASVAYTAIEQAKAQNIDVLLVDTAGRLQNKKNLMEELQKIIRVMQKQEPDAPHDAILVLDATTGQNAFRQVEIFKETIALTGMIVTKLDGTAKGGVVVGLAKQYGLPIHAVGVGESVDDLHAFDAEQFAKSLVGLEV